MKPLPSTPGSEEHRRRGSNSRHHDDAGNNNKKKSPHEREETADQLKGGGFLPPMASTSSMAILLQNCDLPPPQKLFGPDDLVTSKAAFFSPSPIKTKPCLRDDNVLSRLIRDPVGEGETKYKHKDSHAMVEQQQEPQLKPDDERTNKDTGGLLKAMRLSQARAREAEAKASQLGKTTDRMIVLLLDEFMRLHAYRKWVKMLQAEIATLEKRLSASQGAPTTTEAGPPASVDDGCCVAGCDGGGRRAAGPGSKATWVTGAVVVAVAGVGLAVVCKYIF